MPDREDLARAYLDQSPCCGWVWSADGTFVAVYSDPLGILGKPAAELQGRRMSETLDAAIAAAWQGRLAHAIAGDSLAVCERRGNTCWNISMFPIRLDGEVQFAACQAREAAVRSDDEQHLRYAVLQALKLQEQERGRMSRFLHDAIGQNMTALGLQLDLVRMDLQSIAPESCARIEDVQKALEPMMAQVREYTYTLNPSHVDRAGLRSALDRLAARAEPGFPGTVRVHFDSSVRLAPKVASAVYRIAEEAFENALKHSNCSMIEIAVQSSRNGTTLEVRDNGIGFDPGDPSSGRRGLGLPTMEHYAAEAGVMLSIESRRGSGTTIRAEMRSGLGA